MRPISIATCFRRYEEKQNDIRCYQVRLKRKSDIFFRHFFVNSTIANFIARRFEPGFIHPTDWRISNNLYRTHSLPPKRLALDERVNALGEYELVALRGADDFIGQVFVGESERPT